MPHARVTDPQTSHDAANSVTNTAQTKTAIVEIYKKFGPLTDPELIIKYYEMVAKGLAPNASESGIRTRRSELVTMGIIENTGFKEKLPSGRNAIIWGRI